MSLIAENVVFLGGLRENYFTQTLQVGVALGELVNRTCIRVFLIRSLALAVLRVRLSVGACKALFFDMVIFVRRREMTQGTRLKSALLRGGEGKGEHA